MARIALVDDHAFLRKGLESALVGAGHDVVLSTSDCAVSNSRLSDLNADLLFLDQRMPVPGSEVLDRLRNEGLRLPVIFFVNELEDSALLAIMKLSVNGVLFKHSPETDLFEAIDAVLAGRRFIDGSLIDQAIKIAGGDHQEQAIGGLTERELQVAKLAAKGFRNREIGEKVGLTEGTVKIHLHNVYRKLGISNRTSLASVMLKAE